MLIPNIFRPEIFSTTGTSHQRVYIYIHMRTPENSYKKTQRLCLQQEPFTPKGFYTIGNLHQRAFTPRDSYGKGIASTVFTPGNFYTRRRLHLNCLHPKNFNTKTFFTNQPVQQHMSTSANLHQIYSFRSQKTFTTEALHTKELLHQSLSTQNSVYTRKPRNVHGKKSGLQSIIRTPRQAQPLSAKAFAAKFYTGRVLHQEVLTPQNLLGQRVFSPKCLDQTIFTTEDVYTSKRLHQRPFTLEAFYSRGTSHQRVFYARKFLQKLFTLGDFCNKICLRSAPITPNKHCASKSFHTKRL